MKQTKSKKRHVKWSLEKLIDFELYLDAEKGVNDTVLEKREFDLRRKISEEWGPEVIASYQEDTPQNRRWWLDKWLTARKAEAGGGEESVGAVVQSGVSFAGVLLVIIGVMIGLSAAVALLAADVVYVTWAVFLYLVPQLVFIVVAGYVFLCQLVHWQPQVPLIFKSLGILLLQPLYWLSSKLTHSQQSELRAQRLKAAAGLVFSRGKVRRSALQWPVVSLFQLFGTSLSVAIIVGIFGVSLFSPRNYGWGSTTKQVDAESVYAITHAMSQPWQWAIPEGSGSPTLEEVKTSQVFRNTPLPDHFPYLSSWWAFLCLSLLTYTLLPRLLLLAYSLYQGRRSLKHEAFADARSDQLFRKLARPNVTRSVSVAQSTVPASQVAASVETVEKAREMIAEPTTEGASISVPKAHCEVFTYLSLTEEDTELITQRVEDKMGFQVCQYSRMYNMQEQKDCLARLKRITWEDGIPRILFLCRSSQNIVGSLRLFVEQCITNMGENGQVYFCLVGKRDLLGDQLTDQDLDVWREYTDGLKLKCSEVELTALINKKV